MTDDIEELEVLHGILERWDAGLMGIVRVELRPIDKHSGECLIPEIDVPCLQLSSLKWEVEEAIAARRFLAQFKKHATDVLDRVLGEER